MKRLLLGVLALCASGGMAWAADVAPAPVYKAPPAKVYCTQQLCTGFYMGGDVLLSGQNLNLQTGLAAINGIGQNDLALGGHFGYEFWNGQWMFAMEGGGDYGVMQNNAVAEAMGGNTGLWDAYGLAKVGYSLSSLFPIATTGSAQPTLPAQLANALMTPYAIIGIWDRPWGTGFASGAGVQALLATNWTISADYIYVAYSGATVASVPAAGTTLNEQNESIIRTSIDYHF